VELEAALNHLSEEADRQVGVRLQDVERRQDLLGRAMFGLYNIALVLSAPVILIVLLAKKRCRAGLRQRFGSLPESLVQECRDGRTIWIHAVSMGEVNAVAPLVQELKARDARQRIVISTVTETGRETVLRRLDGLAHHLYFPLDFFWVVRRVLRRIAPRLFLVVETELWPNFLRAAAHQGVPCVMVNGRLSTNSFHGYLRARPFFRRILRCFSLCLMQSERDVERMVRLGAEPAKVLRTGNLKFDQRPVNLTVQQQPIALGLHPGEELFVAGSTHPLEEEAILDCYQRLLATVRHLVLLLAPRHIERAEAVKAMAEFRGFVVVRRTQLSASENFAFNGPRVVILDTRGELAAVYRQATLVFVGGSLAPIGGHNPLEPAAWGKAVVFGPYMDHFAEVADLLVSQGGAVQVRDADELTAVMAELLKDRRRLDAMGLCAQQVVRANQGTVSRNADLILQLLHAG
jgi:3-deoxy-D-manno-octulosonic-acid transferase